jgi:L,D-transpeptidase YcbB
MQNTKNPYLILTLFLLLMCIVACNNSQKPPADGAPQIIADADDMDDQVAVNIADLLKRLKETNGVINDSLKLNMAAVVDAFYATNEANPVWCSEEEWLPLADTLFNTIESSELMGLFPNDYHFKKLKQLKQKLAKDSTGKNNATLWTSAEIMLTDGFMRLIKDLKFGRLSADSVSLNPDSVLTNNFFVQQLKGVAKEKKLHTLLTTLQPPHKGYWQLRNAVKSFVDSMDRSSYTYVSYPFKKNDEKDSIYFVKTLAKRLAQSSISAGSNLPDSTQLSNAVKKYQVQKGIKADGRVSSSLIKMMNTSDAERFKRIAITLDRYKQLPRQLPKKYIWVNIPTYNLWLYDNDTVALESRVIVGKADTRTPVLNGAINNMVTYPTWTVPNSIIVKQYLPKLKNNPGYLRRLGLKLVRGKSEVNPYSVNWAKYTKGIPYRVVQNSGDNNALGIFKFNFDNQYAVYLHDTNQRYLFKNGSRALSHGCVRVQQWQELAYYIARNDSITAKPIDSLKYNTDSIKNWIASKEHRRIDVNNPIPIFIRYFSCEGVNGKVKFYDDIYGEDKAMREKYFSGK